VAICRQLSNARTQQDMTNDNRMHNAARLLGKISQGVIHNSEDNTRTDQETRTNVRRNNFASAILKEQLDDDEDDDDKEDEDVHNSDDVLNSGFSNGIYNEQHSNTDHSREKDNHKTNQQTTNAKPFYDELEEYRRSNAIALDMQFIKGMLPDLFAKLNFFESKDDLVFNGTICCYFFKNYRLQRVSNTNGGNKKMMYNSQAMEVFLCYQPNQVIIHG